MPENGLEFQILLPQPPEDGIRAIYHHTWLESGLLLWSPFPQFFWFGLVFKSRILP